MCLSCSFVGSHHAVGGVSWRFGKRALMEALDRHMTYTVCSYFFLARLHAD